MDHPVKSCCRRPEERVWGRHIEYSLAFASTGELESGIVVKLLMIIMPAEYLLSFLGPRTSTTRKREALPNRGLDTKGPQHKTRRGLFFKIDFMGAGTSAASLNRPKNDVSVSVWKVKSPYRFIGARN
jgi:hypothetical protein